MPRTLEQNELRAQRLGQRDPAVGSGDQVVGPLYDEHWAADLPAELAYRFLVELFLCLGRNQRLRTHLEPPAHAVFDGLCRVRLREHLGEEELEEAALVAEPVVAVVLFSSSGSSELLSPQI